MLCAFHPQTVASGNCQGCGRALCAGCFSRFTLARCQSCIQAGNAAVERKVYTSLAISAVLFAGMLTVLLRLPPDPRHPAPLAGKLILSLIAALTYWSYKLLSRSMPRLVIANLIVWAGYFLIKLFVAAIISTVAGPIQIFLALRELRIVQQTKAHLAG